MSYYHKQQTGQEHPNSWYIQRKRCYERIIETKKPPTKKVVEKYDIKFDSQGRVIIPVDLRKPKLEQKVAPRVMKAQESVDWLLKNHMINGELPKLHIAKKYKQLKSIIELAGGDPENIVPTLEKPEHILESLKNEYPNPETLKQKWQVVSTHVKFVPMGLDQKLIDKYGHIFHDLTQKSKENSSDQRKGRKVYRWDKILEATDKLDPLSRFFFRMFDEVPIRSEFGHDIPIVHQVSDQPEDGNFVMDRGGNMVEFHLREWKTKGTKYPDEIIYKFSPELVKLFRNRTDVSHILLPGIKNWGQWVADGLKKAGFPNFPHGKEQAPLKDIASGLRKTLASFRNSEFNTSKPKGSDLAKLMLHDIGTGKTTYWHSNFL